MPGKMNIPNCEVKPDWAGTLESGIPDAWSRQHNHKLRLDRGGAESEGWRGDAYSSGNSYGISTKIPMSKPKLLNAGKMSDMAPMVGDRSQRI
jgi:hypothetical protein